MRNRLRKLFWPLALVLAFLLVWQRVRIIFVVRMGWLQLLGLVLAIAVAIYLILHFVFGWFKR